MTAPHAPWKVLVVDDEEGIHGITRMIFRGYEFEQRPIQLLSAMSGEQARQMLAEHPDIALILLDVVMETDNAGLQLVEYIREELGNRHVRIILRTGHPGYAPEADVIVNHDINDYLSKAELSASRLLTAVVVSLRAYRDIDNARRQCRSVTDSAPDTADSLPLQGIGQQLQQQTRALLKHSSRLQRLELSAMARDMVQDLHSQQQRLHNSCSQLSLETAHEPDQLIELVPLCEQLIQTFLPQARREGWLLDSSVSPDLPRQVSCQPAALQQLLLTCLELAVLQADGDDLKLSLLPADQPGQLHVQINQADGQPLGPAASDWQQRLLRNARQLCLQLDGQWPDEEEGGIRFQLRC